MNKKDFEQWYILQQQIVNGYHLSDNDKRELLRLNHLVMEVCHKIHNDSMLGSL